MSGCGRPGPTAGYWSPPPTRPGLGGRPARIVPVGPFSRREALSYLLGTLTADLDQRQGAIDLVAELGNEPLALAQAAR